MTPPPPTRGFAEVCAAAAVDCGAGAPALAPELGCASSVGGGEEALVLALALALGFADACARAAATVAPVSAAAVAAAFDMPRKSGIKSFTQIHLLHLYVKV